MNVKFYLKSCKCAFILSIYRIYVMSVGSEACMDQHLESCRARESRAAVGVSGVPGAAAACPHLTAWGDKSRLVPRLPLQRPLQPGETPPEPCRPLGGPHPSSPSPTVTYSWEAEDCAITTGCKQTKGRAGPWCNQRMERPAPAPTGPCLVSQNGG